MGSSSTFAWNGRKWSILPATGLGDPAVWCTRRTACMDVGSGLASFWNGRRWALMRLSVIDQLSAVSCARPENCIATGLTNNPARALPPAPAGLAERWTGSAWQVIPGPARTADSGNEQISCPGTRFCMALSAFASDAIAQRWNGRTWTDTRLPVPRGTYGPESLSCGSVTSCVVVAGDVAWVWNGTSWHSTSTGLSGQYVDLQNVSCVSATMCMAIGFGFTGSCDINCTIYLLAEQWNGSSWSVSGNPVLGSGSLNGSLPYSEISCPAATFCMADTIGILTGTGVATWDGHTWTQPTVAFPDLASGLSCGGTSSCVVVGTLLTGRDDVSSAEVWNGASWRATPLAPGGTLASVSCPEPDQCIAVGTTAGDLAMAQSWNGTTWKLLHPVNS